jgi:hypothetical protein
MKSILDLMPEEERKKAIERGKRRLQSKKGQSISPELFVVAEFGYYFGWEGVLAIKRGYVEKESNGKTVKEPFTLDEVMALLEAAKKVWYSKLIEQSHGNLVASQSAYSKSPADTFKRGISPFEERAKVE